MNVERMASPSELSVAATLPVLEVATPASRETRSIEGPTCRATAATVPSFRLARGVVDGCSDAHSKFASQSRTKLQAASSSSKSKLHTSPTQLLPTARAAPSLRRRTVASRAHNLLAAVLQLATLLQLSTNAANLNKHMVAVFPDVHNSRVSTHGGPDQHHLQLHPKFLTRKSRSLRAALSSSRPHPPPRLHCLLYCICCMHGYCRGAEGHVRVPVCTPGRG